MGSIPGLAQQVKDLVLLWLWCRPAAVAPIQNLCWEPPYAAGVALKKRVGGGNVRGDTRIQKHFPYCSSLKFLDLDVFT